MAEPLIRVLPRDVVNRIAAGEVVERPASVVKELVENALDAGAGKIEVEVRAGGRSRIRVADDGVGMGPEDLALAFVAHATSKLTDVEDLLHIATLGFRGEALASIGAVSRTRIVSRPPGASGGHEVVNEFGNVCEIRPAAAPPGTAVDVADLFRNVPARERYLRSARAEMARVTETINRFAVSNPGVEFRLRHGERLVASFAADTSRRERLARAYGRQLFTELKETEGEASGIHLSIFFGPPSRTFADSSRMQFFLNGRFVKDRTLLHAARQPYEDLIFGRRYPAVFLFLTMDPELVDQNVHPAKLEVRFRDGGAVHALVRRSLRTALTRSHHAHPLPIAESADAEREHRVRDAVTDYLESAAARPQGRLFSGRPTPATAPPGPVPVRRAIDFLQVRDSFIVLEDGDGITIVDQHALHERVVYDRIRRRFEAGERETQRLLTPVVVLVPSAEAELLLGEADHLAALGILLEPAGEQGIAVTGLPAVAGRADPAAVVEGILEALREDRWGSETEVVLDVLASHACRAAVKAGDPLTREQVSELLDEAGSLEHAQTCPHGRPTSLRLTWERLEHYFRR